MEKKAFSKSIDHAFNHATGNNENYNFSNRISVIVKADNEKNAIQLAHEKFLPVLDLKTNSFELSNIKMSKIGMIRNLSSGEVKAFINRGLTKAGLFMTKPSNIQRWNSINMILNCNNKLSSRYIKALHWAHNAQNEENKQLSMIFNYFCLEALFKENENDNIQGIVRCFLGFPGGKYYNDVDKEIIKTLQNNDGYNSLIKKYQNI